MNSESIKAIINTAAPFPFFTLQETTNALYIKATVHDTTKAIRIPVTITTAEMSCGPDIVTGLPNPRNAAITIGQRASAIVPATSINRIAECEDNFPAAKKTNEVETQVAPCSAKEINRDACISATGL